MTDVTVRKSIVLKADAETVWGFLTDPEKIGTWFHKPEAPLALGETYGMRGQDSGEIFMSGKVLVAEPFTKLEYEFNLAPMGDVGSKVAWELVPFEGGTQLNLTHTGIPLGDWLFGLDHGWDKHLGDLRDAIAA